MGRLRIPLLLVAVLSAAGVVLASLMAGQPDQLWWWTLGLVFMAWAVLPMLAPWWLSRKKPSFAPVLLIHAVIFNAYAVWLYLQVSLDPQSSTDALIFGFGPIWQWLALAITVGITAALSFARTVALRRSRVLTPPPPP